MIIDWLKQKLKLSICFSTLIFCLPVYPEKDNKEYIVSFKPELISNTSTSNGASSNFTSTTEDVREFWQELKTNNQDIDRQSVIQLYNKARDFRVIHSLLGNLISSQDSNDIGKIRAALHQEVLHNLAKSGKFGNRIGVNDFGSGEMTAKSDIDFTLYPSDPDRVDGDALVTAYKNKFKKLTGMAPKQFDLVAHSFKATIPDWRQASSRADFAIKIREGTRLLKKNPEAYFLEGAYNTQIMVRSADPNRKTFTWYEPDSTGKVHETTVQAAQETAFFYHPESRSRYAWGASVGNWHFYHSHNGDLQAQAKYLLRSIDGTKLLFSGDVSKTSFEKLSADDQQRVVSAIYGKKLYSANIEYILAALQTASQIRKLKDQGKNNLAFDADGMEAFKPLINLIKKDGLGDIDDLKAFNSAKDALSRFGDKLLIENNIISSKTRFKDWLMPNLPDGDYQTVGDDGKIKTITINKETRASLQYSAFFELKDAISMMTTDQIERIRKQNPKASKDIDILKGIIEQESIAFAIAESKPKPLQSYDEWFNNRLQSAQNAFKAINGVSKDKGIIKGSALASLEAYQQGKAAEDYIFQKMRESLYLKPTGHRFIPQIENWISATKAFNEKIDIKLIDKNSKYAKYAPTLLGALDHGESIISVLKVMTKEGEWNDKVTKEMKTQFIGKIPIIGFIYGARQKPGVTLREFIFVSTIPGYAHVKTLEKFSFGSVELLGLLVLEPIRDDAITKAYLGYLPKQNAGLIWAGTKEEKLSASIGLLDLISNKDESIEKKREKIYKYFYYELDWLNPINKVIELELGFSEKEAAQDDLMYSYRKSEKKWLATRVRKYILHWKNETGPFTNTGSFLIRTGGIPEKEFIKKLETQLIADYYKGKQRHLTKVGIEANNKNKKLLGIIAEIGKEKKVLNNTHKSTSNKNKYKHNAEAVMAYNLDKMPTIKPSMVITAVPVTKIAEGEEAKLFKKKTPLSEEYKIEVKVNASEKKHPQPWVIKLSGDIPQLENTQTNNTSKHTLKSDTETNAVIASAYDANGQLIIKSKIDLSIKKFSKEKIPDDKGETKDEERIAACNDSVKAGGDKPETVAIDLGDFVGTAGFYWNMNTIKDQMKVFLDNNLIYDTGCKSETGYHKFQITNGGKAKVEVIPNCEKKSGTRWDFKFDCPAVKTGSTTDEDKDKKPETKKHFVFKRSGAGYHPHWAGSADKVSGYDYFYAYILPSEVDAVIKRNSNFSCDKVPKPVISPVLYPTVWRPGSGKIEVIKKEGFATMKEIDQYRCEVPPWVPRDIPSLICNKWEFQTDPKYWENIKSICGDTSAPSPVTPNPVTPNPEVPNPAEPPSPASINPNDPKIAALISTWISAAEPPKNATHGDRTKYSPWGMIEGTTSQFTSTLNSKPDSARGKSPAEFVWSLRDTLDSVDHCTVSEYVMANLSKTNTSQCKNRYKPLIPKLVGLTQEQAKQRINTLKLRSKVSIGKAAKSAKQAGKVERQDIKQGSTLSRGKTISIWVYGSYVKPISIPNLAGKSVSDAKSKLTSLGLKSKVEKGDPAPSSKLSGTVQSQQPSAGLATKKGSVVAIRIYSSYISPFTSIPNLTGKTVSEAKSLLSSLKLRSKVEMDIAAPSANLSGKVKSQQPPAGLAKKKRTVVAIRIYDTYIPPKLMPDVINMKISMAKQKLMGLGFNDIKVSEGVMAPSKSSNNKVLKQTPKAGTVLKKDEQLTLIVYSDFKEAPIPIIPSTPSVNIPPPNGDALAGGTVSATFPRPASANVWQKYSIPLTADNFGVDQQKFASMMANISSLRIQTELHDGSDIGSVDEIHIGTKFQSTFNNNLGGWNAAGDGTMKWVSSGGVSGGYLQIIDWQSGDLHWAVAPSSWSGNWQNLIGSTLQFYYKTDHPSWGKAKVELSSKPQHRLVLDGKQMTIESGQYTTLSIIPYPISATALDISLSSSNTKCFSITPKIKIPEKKLKVEIDVKAVDAATGCSSVITASTKGYDKSRITLSVKKALLKVPNVVNSMLAEAKQKFESVGLKVVKITRGKIAPSTSFNGKVQSQIPKAGTTAKQGGNSSLIVYSNFIEPAQINPPPKPPETVNSKVLIRQAPIIKKPSYSKQWKPAPGDNKGYQIIEAKISAGQSSWRYINDREGSEKIVDLTAIFKFDVPPSKIIPGSTIELNASGTLTGHSYGKYLSPTISYHSTSNYGKKFQNNQVTLNNGDLPLVKPNTAAVISNAKHGGQFTKRITAKLNVAPSASDSFSIIVNGPERTSIIWPYKLQKATAKPQISKPVPSTSQGTTSSSNNPAQTEARACWNNQPGLGVIRISTVNNPDFSQCGFVGGCTEAKKWADDNNYSFSYNCINDIPTSTSSNTDENDKSQAAYCVAFENNFAFDLENITLDKSIPTKQAIKQALTNRQFTSSDFKPTKDGIILLAFPLGSPESSQFKVNKKYVLPLNINNLNKGKRTQFKLPFMLTVANKDKNCATLKKRLKLKPKTEVITLNKNTTFLKNDSDDNGKTTTIGGPLIAGWSNSHINEHIAGLLQLIESFDCFVATAVYRTNTNQELHSLRHFRDEVLLSSPAGKSLVDIYYQNGPKLSAWLKPRPQIREVIKPLITSISKLVQNIPEERHPFFDANLAVMLGVSDVLLRSFGLEGNGKIPLSLFNPLATESAIPFNILAPVTKDLPQFSFKQIR